MQINNKDLINNGRFSKENNIDSHILNKSDLIFIENRLKKQEFLKIKILSIN